MSYLQVRQCEDQEGLIEPFGIMHDFRCIYRDRTLLYLLSHHPVTYSQRPRLAPRTITNILQTRNTDTSMNSDLLHHDLILDCVARRGYS